MANDLMARHFPRGETQNPMKNPNFLQDKQELFRPFNGFLEWTTKCDRRGTGFLWREGNHEVEEQAIIKRWF